MTKTYRADNGKFVRKDNPVAVIGRLRDQRERERAEMAAAAEMARRANARRNGYSGPLTRGELSAMLQGSAAS